VIVELGTVPGWALTVVGAVLSWLASWYYYTKSSRHVLGEKGRVRAELASRLAVSLLAAPPNVDDVPQGWLATVLAGEYRRLGLSRSAVSHLDVLEVLEIAAAEAHRHTMVDSARRDEAVKKLHGLVLDVQNAAVTNVNRRDLVDSWFADHTAFTATGVVCVVAAIMSIAAPQQMSGLVVLGAAFLTLFQSPPQTALSQLPKGIRGFAHIASGGITGLRARDKIS
jgi:hypothetical protein